MIGFGGGCHWCTEAVFQSIEGVVKVEQGYIASKAPNDNLSEAVIVHYLPKKVSLERLLEIHIHTHKATSNHSLRSKYRSAVYCFSADDEEEAKILLERLQQQFQKKLVTQILPFKIFKASRESIQDYYRKNPEAPFCQKYILPKLKKMEKIGVKEEKRE